MAASEQVSEPHGELHVFTDEKLFIVAARTNSQNDRFYIRPDTRKNLNKNQVDAYAKFERWTFLNINYDYQFSKSCGRMFMKCFKEPLASG